MYRSPSLMILFFSELALLVFMFLLSRSLRRSLDVKFEQRSLSAERGKEIPCVLRVANAGRLPVGRFRVRCRYFYLQEQESDAEYLYGSAGRGSSSLQIHAHAWYCGIICFELEELGSYDYLALFLAAKDISERMQVAIFPADRRLRIEIPYPERRQTFVGEENALYCTGAETDEIRQVREYLAGDAKRHIHWKQSAKTDRLWTKEYEKGTEFCADIWLEVSPCRLCGMDAFYRLLWAVVMGLLQEARMVRVCWYDGVEGQLKVHSVTDSAQCRELFLCLYQEKGFRTERAMAQRHTFLQEQCFRLDTELRLYWAERLLHRFSENMLDREIEEGVFHI